MKWNTNRDSNLIVKFADQVAALNFIHGETCKRYTTKVTSQGGGVVDTTIGLIKVARH